MSNFSSITVRTVEHAPAVQGRKAFDIGYFIDNTGSDQQLSRAEAPAVAQFYLEPITDMRSANDHHVRKFHGLVAIHCSCPNRSSSAGGTVSLVRKPWSS